MHLFTRFFSIVIAFLSLAPCIAMTAVADGVSVGWEPASIAEPQYIREESQYSLINFENGHQKMILQVSIKISEFKEGQKSLWIFPVPSNPEDVEVDALRGSDFPDITGHFTRDVANLSAQKSFLFTSATQLYPIPISYMTLYGEDEVIKLGEHNAVFGGRSDPVKTPDNVTVHQHIEKFGLATEIITADNGTTMNDYFLSRGLVLPENATDLIDGYITKQFSFAASWIEDNEEFVGNADPDNSIFDLGVCLSFPTDEVFFPLILTSVYGDETVPIVLQIIDTVVPSRNNTVGTDLEPWIDYAYAQDVFVRGGLSDFFQEQIESEGIGPDDYYEYEGEPYHGTIGVDLDITYTIVVIESPSNQLLGDIWFSDEELPEISTDMFMINNWGLFPLILAPVLSVLSSLLAGMITYRKFRPDKKKFAMLGLSNLLTIVGFAAISVHSDVSYRYVDLSVIDWNGDGENKPNEPVPVVRFIAAFSLMFVSTSLLTHAAIYFAF